ncbi:hypothetical protein UA08_00772 [Talaromyces atroroseus]|uniref:Zn(2)-C6 fungal-type domain-containing protein n=1 Tax=Talaromyces atroroseus TaxID=1441469 RepID=A0A225B8X0_TALAT|nr:hypothetical protein UA08_00772 [Talaromyces atroroseus]OKL63836.1 hypothetical protein UA08_00772 [Talaromyces atroroseus]
MPPLSSGRSSSACHRCHKRKVRCSRANAYRWFQELPCRSCRMANQRCTYPIRDRNITVSESFVRSLEARALAYAPDASPSSGHESLRGSTAQGYQPPLVEDSTSEAFLARLKQIRQQNAGPVFPDLQDHDSSPSNPHTDYSSPSYDYVQLDFDTSHSPCSFKLPPYPYALALLDQFDVFLGHDFHWFLRKSFRRRLELTYRNPDSPQVKDRVWLCTLLVVFALGESYNVGRPPEIRLGQVVVPGENGSSVSGPPPGTVFFEHALALLKVRYEDPTIDQIEALNLITFYSYSLHRKRAAYVYAGLSARLSNILRLHKPSPPSSFSPIEIEHRKRVWWTAYCLDRMTSTETGLLPIFHRDQIELAYPCDEMLPLEDADEFSDGISLATQVQLAFLHADICETVKNLGDGDTAYDKKLTEPIIQQLETLRLRLPPHLSFDVEDGMPRAMQEMSNRSLASLYQRYYQCFVLLLRPLFLKQINYLLSNDAVNASQESLKYMTNICLRAARTNLLLIIGLRQCDRMTKFGFWESLHLFSGLTIVSLAISVNLRWPGSFDEKPDDGETYQTARCLLSEMADAGNLASKGQLRMLDEVEALQDVLTGADSTAFELFNLWDMEAWLK